MRCCTWLPFFAEKMDTTIKCQCLEFVTQNLVLTNLRQSGSPTQNTFQIMGLECWKHILHSDSREHRDTPSLSLGQLQPGTPSPTYQCEDHACTSPGVRNFSVSLTVPTYRPQLREASDFSRCSVSLRNPSCLAHSLLSNNGLV